MPGLDDIFGGSKQYGFTKDDINNTVAGRASEINDFSSQLASMRAQYLAQIPGLAKTSFDQFGNDAATAFGAKGMDTGSGAFQSALARYAIPATAGMINTGYQTGVSGATAVDSARGALAGQTIQSQTAGMSAPTANPLWGALGNFAGNAATMYLGSKMFPGLNPGGMTPQTLSNGQAVRNNGSDTGKLINGDWG